MKFLYETKAINLFFKKMSPFPPCRFHAKFCDAHEIGNSLKERVDKICFMNFVDLRPPGILAQVDIATLGCFNRSMQLLSFGDGRAPWPSKEFISANVIFLKNSYKSS
jgi:hypothetical protein